MTFAFLLGDTLYRVHSEVGTGPARIVVKEECSTREQPMESSDEDSQ